MVSIADVDPHEDELGIVYLDHDPGRAALYTIDRDIGRSIYIAARHMSNAWHTVGKDCVLVDWKSPALHKEPTPPGEVPWLRAERLHQRILTESRSNHPGSMWAAALGGNYMWLWGYAMELLCLHRTITGAPHGLTPVVYTLEVMPPVLLDTILERTEPPVSMQAEYHVTTADGQFVEAVDSWRRYYVKRRQKLLKWSARPVPHWLERTQDGFKLKL